MVKATRGRSEFRDLMKATMPGMVPASEMATPIVWIISMNCTKGSCPVSSIFSRAGRAGQ